MKGRIVLCPYHGDGFGNLVWPVRTGMPLVTRIEVVQAGGFLLGYRNSCQQCVRLEAMLDGHLQTRLTHRTMNVSCYYYQYYSSSYMYMKRIRYLKELLYRVT